MWQEVTIDGKTRDLIIVHMNLHKLVKRGQSHFGLGTRTVKTHLIKGFEKQLS